MCMKKQEPLWEIFWEIPDCPPFLTSEPARMFTDGMREFCAEDFSDCILEYRNNVNIWYLDAHEWSRLDKVLFDRMLDDIEWAQKINTIAETHCYPCLVYLDELQSKRLDVLTNSQLFDVYQAFMDAYIPAHASGHPANVLEMKNQRLSGYLKEYIEEQVLKKHYPGNADEIFTILVAPTKDMSPQKEAKSFYNLVLCIEKDKKAVEYFSLSSNEDVLEVLEQNCLNIWKKLKKHCNDYCWTVYNWEGPPHSLLDYIEMIKSFLHSDQKAEVELRKMNEEQSDLIEQKKQIAEDLDFDNNHTTLLHIASEIMFLKAIRKDCMYKGAWVSEGLYNEIAKRLGVSLHEARFIFYFEMKQALIDDTFDKKKLKERTKEVILHQRAGRADIVLGGQAAVDFIDTLNIKAPDHDVQEIKGQVAFPGKVVGTLKYVNTPDMMHKMEEGDILMAYVTQPNLLPAMKKASAFITEFGGITCHAAIVAREWKVPCVVGLKNVTKVFKDGDRVEVDADKGIVKRIS